MQLRVVWQTLYLANHSIHNDENKEGANLFDTIVLPLEVRSQNLASRTQYELRLRTILFMRFMRFMRYVLNPASN